MGLSSQIKKWVWPRYGAIRYYHMSWLGGGGKGLSCFPEGGALLLLGNKQWTEWWGNTGPDQRVCLPLFFTVSGLRGKSVGMDNLSTVLYTVLLGEQFLPVRHLFVSILYLFVINFVAVTVHLLISLQFPVNCSYLNLVCLPFVSYWRGRGQ